MFELRTKTHRSTQTVMSDGERKAKTVHERELQRGLGYVPVNGFLLFFTCGEWGATAGVTWSPWKLTFP